MHFFYERQGNEWNFSGEYFLLKNVMRALEKDFSQKVFFSKNSLSIRYNLRPFQIQARTASLSFQKGIAQALAKELIEGRQEAELISTVVLTSEDNFVWQSMQEIIPSLEFLWAASASTNKHEVYYFNVDKDDFKQSLPLFLKAQNIFVTCFNLKIAKTLDLLRRRLGIDARLFIELHNMATIACWPFHEWGMGETFKASDVFISTCSYDQEALKLSYPKARVELLPFCALELDQVEAKNIFQSPVVFAYVGRISVQKNLHTLLAALSLLKMQNFECHFYGAEDGLGSPNMEDYPEGYLDCLKDLASRLGLQDKVVFKGHYPREKLYEELHDPKVILVSPSLHSDENFGMALFRGLLSGQRVVCSDWGGHYDFSQQFPKQTLLVPVYQTINGPQLSIFDLKSALEKSVSLPHQEASLPAYYDQKVLSQKVQKLATHLPSDASLLERSDLATKIHQKRTDYLSLENSKGCKIFENYSDPLVQPFFQAYGMKNVPKINGPLQLVPWAKIQEKKIVIDDLHRGAREYELGQGVELRTWDQQKITVPSEVFQKLWDNGDVFTGVEAG